jgi:hypothetical protein
MTTQLTLTTSRSSLRRNLIGEGLGWLGGGGLSVRAACSASLVAGARKDGECARDHAPPPRARVSRPYPSDLSRFLPLQVWLVERSTATGLFY